MKDLYLDSFNITNKSSISVNFTKSDVQQMIDVTVQQAIMTALQAQKITTSQLSESQSQLSSVKNDDHIIISV